MGGIYRIKNKINSHFYLGSASEFRRRKEQHFLMLSKGKHVNIKLQNAVNKYGIENFIFEIVKIVDNTTVENLTLVEQSYLDACNKDEVYNLCFTANGGGADVLKIPVFLVDLQYNILLSFDSMIKLKDYLGMSAITKYHCDNIRRVVGKKYRIFTKTYYENNVDRINILRNKANYKKLFKDSFNLCISYSTLKENPLPLRDFCDKYLEEDKKQKLLELEANYINKVGNIINKK